MPKAAPITHLALALNTMLEREFVSPLTSIRGALEILRDFSDLSNEDRNRFINNALQDCTRLELGVEQLASTVYSSIDESDQGPLPREPEENDSEYIERIRFFEKEQFVEIDFSDFVFSSSKIVNEFYDQIDRLIEGTGKRWYIVVNYHQCRIWPEAWVAFAHRGKKVNVSYSLGTVRYIDASAVEKNSSMLADPELFASRDDALVHIDQIRQSTNDS